MTSSRSARWQRARSIFQGIAQLLPAHTISFGTARASASTEYWDVPHEAASPCSEADALARFAEVFTEAVRVRPVSDVPLGAFLSGGVNSSAVVDAVRPPVRSGQWSPPASPSRNGIQ